MFVRKAAVLNIYVFAVLAFFGTLYLSPTITYAADTLPMRIAIDARDLPRKLLSARLSIPIRPLENERTVDLWYPKWVPGSHGPGGPIANVAGIRIQSPDGKILSWRRVAGEVYRLTVTVPAGVDALEIEVRYIANQPTTNSMGHDVFGSTHVGLISPGSVLFYLDGINIDDQQIEAELQLPSQWQASTAMGIASKNEEEVLRYRPTTLRHFVDSPIMCGRYRNVIELNPDGTHPLHRLHVFSEIESATKLSEGVTGNMRRMVAEAGELMGTHPFDQFEILLAVTDELPANGLEHLRSSMNILPRSAVASPQAMKGWNRLLIPHEYMHAWCGKYRRPADMLTTDFHSPKGTDLLWVYEGLTQYAGELVEARAGIMNPAEFRDRLAVELRIATHQQGRSWRSLADTAAASHVLRDRSSAWPRLRGGQDYYMEGMLLWLEIDSILRIKSEGKLSLDDFCHQFFFCEGAAQVPKPHDREEIISTLNGLLAYDWEGLIRRRVESPQESFDPALAELLGYRLTISQTPPKIPANTFRYVATLDEYDSIGCTFSNSGVVTDLLLGSPADQAKLAPGTQVVGINGHTWSASGLIDAIAATDDGATIELLVENDQRLRTVQIPYDGGPRYLTLVRDTNRPDLLEKILAPKSKL
ncbi:MAG: hypothetical protein R3C53_13160 [Pirellulaceae bacterium]